MYDINSSFKLIDDVEDLKHSQFQHTLPIANTTTKNEEVTMPRAVSTLTGLLVVATVAYKYRDNVASETAEIRDRLQNVKSTVDDIAAGTVHKVNVANDTSMFLIGYKPLLFHLPSF